MKNILTILGLPLWLGLVAPSVGGAQTPVPTAGPNELVILNAVANTVSEMVFIAGMNFGTSPPEVTLSGVPLTIVSSTPTDIGAVLPAWASATPGTYLLTVKRGNGEPKSDWFNLTIGAVGPKGDKGDQGDQGIQGPIGLTGAPGAAGEKGDPGPSTAFTRVEGIDGGLAPVSPGFWFDPLFTLLAVINSLDLEAGAYVVFAELKGITPGFATIPTASTYIRCDVRDPVGNVWASSVFAPSGISGSTQQVHGAGILTSAGTVQLVCPLKPFDQGGRIFGFSARRLTAIKVGALTVQ